MRMFNARKKVTQVERFYRSNSGYMEEINNFLKKEDIEYVDLKSDKNTVFLVHNQYLEDQFGKPYDGRI